MSDFVGAQNVLKGPSSPNAPAPCGRRPQHQPASTFEVLPEPLADLREFLATVFAQWDDALERLRKFVED